MLMIVLDVTIVNVALPDIQTALHFTNASLAWVVNAYLIAFGGLLLLAGRLVYCWASPISWSGCRVVHVRFAGLRAGAELRRCSSRPGSCRGPGAR